MNTKGGSRRRGVSGALGNRGGQALLIAVLLMTVILLVGILFAAVVSFNQEQSGRGIDAVAAQQVAEAGINYASAMLESSPQGADWRPPFVAYSGTGTEVATDTTTWPRDPATWPNPPAKYEDGTVDFNFYGPDGLEGTDDDYYADFEIVRGWFPLRHGSFTAPGTFVRHGFFRYPNPNQVAGGTGGLDSPNIGRGYFLLQVTYDPDPPYEPGDATTQDRLSGNTRIISIGRAVRESNVFRRLVAYKPLGLTDHLRWITNKSGQARDAVLGVRPLVDMDNSSTWDTSEALYNYFPGPIRSEVPLYWAGQQIGTGPAAVPSTVFRLRDTPAANEGYLRDDDLLLGRGLYALDENTTGGAAVQLNGGTLDLLPLSVAPDAATPPANVYVGSRDVPALAPVDLDAKDPTSGIARYRALTADTGETVRADSADDDNAISPGDPVNTGLYGGGAGVYVGNRSEVQYRGADGRSDLTALANDWLKTGEGEAAVGNVTGWNALFTAYTPPAVEIELFPTEAAVLATCTASSSSSTFPIAAGALWWPNHVAGAPGIKITRHDQRWRRFDDGHVGEDSGQNVLVVDYPDYPNQVIYAEGNVRVRGVLPHRDSTVPATDRSFDLTIVSGATLYIDGEIMTAQDVAGRKVDMNDTGPGVTDEDTAKVALLAADYVCLNPTQLVPQLTSGLVTAAADNEANPSLADQHWELFPSATGTCWSQWRFGWPDIDYGGDGDGDGTPGTEVDAAVQVALTPIQSAADPGPSGVGFTVYNEAAAASAPFQFPGATPLDPYTFLFVPPGALVGAVSAGPQISNAILPNWQIPGSTPAAAFANPELPYNITTYATKAIGSRNAVSIFHRDPQLGTGATAYLLKKWKVEELVQDSDSAYMLPRGAVHAKVNALIYAQRGSWFVIPGQFFDPEAATRDLNGDSTISPEESLYAARFRRYNYEITVRGAITEDHTAPLGAVQTWTNRWAYPVYNEDGTSLIWGTIRYQFDERLRLDRDQAPTTLSGTVRSSSTLPDTPRYLLPKLPCLPSSPTLIYTGGTS